MKLTKNQTIAGAVAGAIAVGLLLWAGFNRIDGDAAATRDNFSDLDRAVENLN